MNIKEKFLKNQSFFFAAPAFLWQFLFLYCPLALLVLSSFLKNGSYVSPIFTLEYYRIIFQSAYFKIMFRSLSLAFFTAVFCVVAAYPIAYFIALRIKHFKNIFIFFIALPLWINYLVEVYSWYFLLEKEGVVNNFLLKIGLIKSPLSLLNNTFAVYLVMFYCFLPFAALPLYSVLEKFDFRLIEVSLDLGAGYWFTFFKIILPLTLRGLRNGFFLVFIPAFGEFAIPLLLSGNKNFYVGSLTSHLFLVADNMPLAAAFSTFSMIVLLMISLMFYMILKSKFKEEKGIDTWQF